MRGLSEIEDIQLAIGLCEIPLSDEGCKDRRQSLLLDLLASTQIEEIKDA
jgi:hypothetical protein